MSAAIEQLFDNRITVDDFMTFIEHPLANDKSFELIDGYVTMMASPSPNHQRISGYIARKIGNYLEGKSCEVFQDLDLLLFEIDSQKCENVFRPDIMIVCDDSKITERGYEGIPDLVIEIVSKSTGRYDYSVKCKAYMKYGVKEYWIVDSLVNQILVYVYNDNIIRRYTFDDKIMIRLLNNLTIDFAEISAIIK